MENEKFNRRKRQIDRFRLFSLVAFKFSHRLLFITSRELKYCEFENRVICRHKVSAIITEWDYCHDLHCDD